MISETALDRLHGLLGPPDLSGTRYEIKTLLGPSDGWTKTIAPGSVHYSPDGTAGQVTAVKTCYDFIAQANGVNRYNWWRNTTTGTRYP